MPLPHEDLQTTWQRHYSASVEAYRSGQQSFMLHLPPDLAVRFPVYQTLEILAGRYGFGRIQQALDPAQTVPSPLQDQPMVQDGSWLKKTRMVGINVRTIGTFWNVINYTLTLPAIHDSIHLLPVWEPGVVGSLYGMISWNINPEFFSKDLYAAFPQLDTAEKQLKVVVNLLHLMGRTVGMDVIPHTDRFSEMTLCQPTLFEWVRRDGPTLVDHSEGVTEQVLAVIAEWAQTQGLLSATEMTQWPPTAYPPDQLFGYPHDYAGRLQRRLSLIQYLVERGFETLPMTMAPPYRGLHSQTDEVVVDEYGQNWYQYAFNKPQKMSRVFGPLTRYKFYYSKNDNQDWELDFDRPNKAAWTYICEQYAACQQQFNFDFMRGDMAHVQMRPEGVPADTSIEFIDPLRSIKQFVQQRGVPYFAFFAETFLAPPDTMGYGDELAHLEVIEADSTLGDLQSTVVNSDLFLTRFRQYLDLARTRRFAPNFTVMTADKDDPRFDEFYQTGNVFRYFIALFQNDLPSYVGLGFELRNLHLERGANEEYSKLYVFRIQDDAQTDKVTHGPYVWGQNADQFQTLTRLRLLADQIGPELAGQSVRWLIPPDPTGSQSVVAWTVGNTAPYIFVANADPGQPARHVTVPIEGTLTDATWQCVLDTAVEEDPHIIRSNGYHLVLPPLEAGACRVYVNP